VKPEDRFPAIAEQFKRAKDGACFLYVAKDGDAANTAVRELARLSGGVAHLTTRKVTMAGDKVFNVATFDAETRGWEPENVWVDEAAGIDIEAFQRLGAHARR